MYKRKRQNFWVFNLVLVLIVMAIVTGCTNQSQNSESIPGESQERIIVDMSGKEVKVSAEINKAVITCYGGATHNLAVLGVAEKIVAQPSMEKFPVLLKINQFFKDIPDVGSFDNVNVEEILKLNPDVVIASIGSPQGNQKIEEAGIPVVTVLTGKGDVEGLKKELLMLGELFNKQEQAKALVAYWEKNLKMIADRTAAIPEEQKKKVYYMLGDFLHTNGEGSWGQHFITAAGGINVAKEIGDARDINIEQLLNWNPDTIILSSNEGRFISIEEVQSNPQMANIKAVQENRLYLCPISTFWWDRPSAEAILGIMWLAKTLYPTEFADLDIEGETKDFYRQFYQYELTDEEVQSFLNPKA